MQSKKSASIELPYTPSSFKEGRVQGLGHPDLISELKKMVLFPRQILGSKTVVYKEQPNLILETRLLSSGEFPWVRQLVKQFKWRGLQNFLLSPLRKSKAVKSYLAACHLLRHGLLTPVPLGAVECRSLGFIRYNIYVTEVIDDFMNLKQYRDRLPHGSQGMDEVLRNLAEYTRQMHDSGLLHRDLNLSNFLLQGEPGSFRLYLVDLNRARFKPHLPYWKRAVDLSRLDLKEWQEPFFRYYCGDRLAPEAMLRIANLIRFRRRSWRQVAKRTNNVRKRIGLK